MPGKREHSHERRPTTYAIHDDGNLDDPHRLPSAVQRLSRSWAVFHGP
jgi:hypothetical protein